MKRLMALIVVAVIFGVAGVTFAAGDQNQGTTGSGTTSTGTTSQGAGTQDRNGR